MSQADKSGWTTTTRNIEDEFHRLLGEKALTAASKFFITAHAHSAMKQIRLLSSTPDIQGLFMTAHDVFDEAQGSGFVNIYHLDHVDREVSARFCNIKSEVKKPAMCIYNRESRDLLILEHQPFNYGFVNTTVIGVFSKSFLQDEQNHYAHAGCLSINGHGLLILGDQGSGKSTLVSKILSRLERNISTAVDFCTDDWVFLEEQGKILRAKRSSKEYRIDADTIRNNAISLSDSFLRAIHRNNIQEKAAKFSMPVDSVCSEFGFVASELIECESIFILNPSQGNFIERPTYESIEGIIRSSTKNVPPLTATELHDVAEFWRRQIETRQVVSLNNRQPNMTIDRVADEIFNMIGVNLK